MTVHLAGILRRKLLLIEVLAILSVATGSVLLAMGFPQYEREAEYLYVHEIVLENEGLEPYVLRDFSIGIPLNTSTQMSYVVDCTPVGNLQIDSQGNPCVAFPETILEPGGSLTVRTTIRVLTTTPTIMSGDESECLSSIPLELIDQFCKSEGPFLADDPTIVSLARGVLKGANCSQGNVLTIVEAMAEWIDQNVLYETHMPPLYSNETLLAKTGDSDELANLLISMCRATRIPAYLQTGFIVNSTETVIHLDGHLRSEGLVGHAWAIVYIPPLGWVPVDMTHYDSSQGPVSHITMSAWASGLVIQGSNIISKDYVAELKNLSKDLNDGNIYEQDSNRLTTLKNETRLTFPMQFYAGAILLSSGALESAAIRIHRRRKSRSKAGSMEGVEETQSDTSKSMP